MESGVSSKFTCNIHRPFYTWKRGQAKRKHSGKDCPKATELKVYAYSDTDLGKVLFHNEMLCNRENMDLLSKIYQFSSVEFLKICALPSVHL